MEFQHRSGGLGGWCRQALRCLHRSLWDCLWPSVVKFFSCLPVVDSCPIFLDTGGFVSRVSITVWGCFYLGEKLDCIFCLGDVLSIMIISSCRRT